MNAFEQGKAIEHRGMCILMPFLEERAYRGRIVWMAKGPLSRYLQVTLGDLMMNSDEATAWSIEVKIEQVWTGNLFLEQWSNRNLDDRANHAELGTTPGWLQTLKSDILLNYFLDSDILLSLPLFKLQQWAFGAGDAPPNLYNYPIKKQCKRSQKNDTWGYCVPVLVLERLGLVKRYSVRQLELLSPTG